MATNSNKDTIYIDIDDEITTVIEKVRNSSERIVALVLPKRATVLQSIVNMKLLKRSADQAKKHVVLITSETSLFPLAGAVGFYVARNLQTKPEVPAAAGEVSDTVDDNNDDSGVDFSAETASTTPVGQLAAAAGAPNTTFAPTPTDNIETLELDDDVDTTSDNKPLMSPAQKDAKAKQKKDRKLAIPNFNRFRVLLVVGVVALIALGGFLYVAANVLPKATITIKTDTNDVNSSMTLTLDSVAKQLDSKNGVVPAQVVSLQKNGSQQVAATGKQNNGKKASGQVRLSLDSCAQDQVSVPSGVGVTSNGLTFITQSAVTLSSIKVAGQCKNADFPSISTATVTVIAQNAGAQYNVPATTFKVSGYSSVSASSDAAFTGGTDDIVQVVSQADVDSASKKITGDSSDTVKAELTNKVKQQGLFAVATTFHAGEPVIAQSAKVGDQVSTVTVTQSTTYTMFGVQEADLKTLVDADIKDKIDPNKQSILTEGLSKANFHVNNITDKSAQIGFSTTATAGPDLKVDAVKQQIAGKKAGDIKTMLKSDPGITDVQVTMSPFWVTKAPSKPAKITVTFVKSTP